MNKELHELNMTTNLWLNQPVVRLGNGTATDNNDNGKNMSTIKNYYWRNVNADDKFKQEAGRGNQSANRSSSWTMVVLWIDRIIQASQYIASASCTLRREMKVYLNKSYGDRLQCILHALNQTPPSDWWAVLR